jgi:hypothetical protein
VLGWYVLIRREGADSPQDPPVARWETSVFGLDWLNDLVKADQAVDLVGNGYPNRYSVAAVSWRFNRRFQLNALVPWCLACWSPPCVASHGPNAVFAILPFLPAEQWR